MVICRRQVPCRTGGLTIGASDASLTMGPITPKGWDGSRPVAGISRCGPLFLLRRTGRRYGHCTKVHYANASGKRARNRDFAQIAAIFRMRDRRINVCLFVPDSDRGEELRHI